MYRLHRISSVKLKVSSRSTENVGKRRGKSNSTPSLSEEGNDFISGVRRDVVWDFLSLPLRFCSLLGFPSDATLREDRKGPGNPELARNRLSYLREKGASNSESSKRECPHEMRKGTCSKGWGRERGKIEKSFAYLAFARMYFVPFRLLLFCSSSDIVKWRVDIGLECLLAFGSLSRVSRALLQIGKYTVCMHFPFWARNISAAKGGYR